MDENFSEKLERPDMPYPLLPFFLRMEYETEKYGFYDDTTFVCSPFYISCVGQVEKKPNDLRWHFFLNVLPPDEVWEGDWIPFHYLHYMNKQKIIDKMMDMGVWMEVTQEGIDQISRILRHQMNVILRDKSTENEDEDENDEIA